MTDSVKELYSNYNNLSLDDKIEYLRLINLRDVTNDEIKENKIKNSIKIWPYLDDISQTIIPYTSDNLSEDVNAVVNLDFSSVKKVTSSGAAIALVKLIKMLIKRINIYRLVLPEDQIIARFFQESGFFYVLDSYFTFIKKDLFETIEIYKSVKPYIIYDERNKKRIISFPVYILKYNDKRDRESVDNFMDWITDVFSRYLSNYDIQYNTLLTIIKEIAKNSQDHTKADSYFGFDVIEDEISNSGELLFSFTDMGVGIIANVKNNAPKGYIRIKEKFSFADAYRFAFTTGKTTSINPRNKGIGMSMIKDGVELLNLDLTIWDGRSMLFIPERITHSEIRRNTFDTGNSVGFYYYGRLKF